MIETRSNYVAQRDKMDLCVTLLLSDFHSICPKIGLTMLTGLTKCY